MNGKRTGAAVLLMVDAMPRIQDLEYGLQMQFHWLLQNGATFGIWPVAAIDAAQAAELPFWTDVFRTRLIGQIASPKIAQELAIYDGINTANQMPGVEFCAWLGKEWMNYWIPRF